MHATFDSDGQRTLADEAEAREVLSRDPAVASGLMRMELHAFKVVMERGATAG